MGFISRAITSIREISQEPATEAKYTDARLLVWIEQAYSHVYQEINRRAQAPVLVDYSITLDEDHRIYELPPTIQRVRDVAMQDSSENLVWNPNQRSIHHDLGEGLRMDGQTLRFTSDPVDGYILKIRYVPSGCIRLHDGAIDDDAHIVNDTGDDNDCTIILDTTPTTGALDTRTNAYAGSMFRVISAGTNNFEQTRTITSHDEVTGKVVLEPSFLATKLPGVTGADVIYEIAPPMHDSIDMLIATYVAFNLVSIEGDKGRQESIRIMWLEQLGDAVAQFNHTNALTDGAQRGGRYGSRHVSSRFWGSRGSRGVGF